MKKIYNVFTIAALSMLFLSTIGFGQGLKIMFVGRGDIDDIANSAYQSEIDLWDSLVAWGYEPTYWPGSQVQNGGLDDFYPDYDGVFISETISSNQANGLATDGYVLPIVSLESWVVRVDRWNWITDNTTGFFQTAAASATEDNQYIIIKDNYHWITRDYNVDDEVRWTTGADLANINVIQTSSFMEEVQTFTSKLAIDKAHEDMADFWSMVTVDEFTGPNRIFIWGMNALGLDDGTLGKSDGTPEFFQLVRNACEWAWLGKEVGVNDVKQEVFGLAAFPNPTVDNVTIRFNSPVDSKAVATLYNITGQRIATFNKDAVAGKNFIVFNTDDYAAGVYHLGLEVGGHVEYVKLVIQ